MKIIKYVESMIVLLLFEGLFISSVFLRINIVILQNWVLIYFIERCMMLIEQF